MVTAFVPAYDTERLGAGLRACERIVAVHESLRVPATFFVVGTLLEEEGTAYRDLLGGSDLFEISSHTYSHRMLRDHPICGPAVGPEEVRTELAKGAFLVRIPFIEDDARVVRANVTFEKGMLDAIDAAARERGLTRSAFLASAARKEIEAV